VQQAHQLQEQLLEQELLQPELQQQELLQAPEQIRQPSNL
jgi:hypothetical protein